MPKTQLYPKIESSLIKNPSRFFAIPVFGGLIKLFMLIPVGIELAVLSLVMWILSICNSLVVLTTGKYWKNTYELQVGVIHLSTKTYYFFTGLTNTYPGFDLKSKAIPVEIHMPTRPNRLFAIPFFGGFARWILLIPFFVYIAVISRAAGIGMVVASIPVLVKGKYPESLYEINRDSFRLSQAMAMYMLGLSDTYPSFWISMNHKVIKWILIILGILGILTNYSGNFAGRPSNSMQNQYQAPTSQNNSSY